MSTIQISGDLLRKVQLTQLQILLDVIKFCEARGICYFLTSGTLLGAIRHSGFIPWDDDIDISMPRKDFDRFVEASKELPEQYIFQSTSVDKNYPNAMAKVRKKETTMKEPSMSHLNINHGVWIDVFPLDEVSNIEKLEKRRRIIEIISTAICYKLKVRTIKKARTKVMCALLGLLGVKNLDKLRTKVMTKENNKNGAYLTSFGSNLGCKRLLFKKEVYFPARSAKFEGAEIAIPNDAEQWLTNAYGEYMELPPVEQRINKHVISELNI